MLQEGPLLFLGMHSYEAFPSRSDLTAEAVNVLRANCYYWIQMCVFSHPQSPVAVGK